MVAFGPSAFDEKERHHYDFVLLGWETYRGRQTLLVESKPKLDAGFIPLWGKYWIDPEKASFIRVELAQQSIGDFAYLEKKAMAFQAIPQAIQTIEYGVEHEGMRFPSRFFLEEAYVDKDKERFVLSSLEVLYEDYKFFKVNIDVKEKIEKSGVDE
jgi:hypothetical protein